MHSTTLQNTLRTTPLTLLVLVGCQAGGAPPASTDERAVDAPAQVQPPTIPPGGRLYEAREGFVTTPSGADPDADRPVTPPEGSGFSLVAYPAEPGRFHAYLTDDPGDGERHPAIVWITGGDVSTVGPVWIEDPAESEQTAAAYRKAGIVTMFPSLRGGHDNPGQREGFFGEVDDVIAAAQYLAERSYVDPDRIYLGGHSTGGTLVLLVAQTSDRFRAVFSFGPVSDPRWYGDEFVAYSGDDRRDPFLRAPALWMAGIRSPTFVFEGATDGNLDSLQRLAAASANPLVGFFPLNRANHFTALAPVNELLAAKVVADNGAEVAIDVSAEDVERVFYRGTPWSGPHRALEDLPPRAREAPLPREQYRVEERPSSVRGGGEGWISTRNVRELRLGLKTASEIEPNLRHSAAMRVLWYDDGRVLDFVREGLRKISGEVRAGSRASAMAKLVSGSPETLELSQALCGDVEGVFERVGALSKERAAAAIIDECDLRRFGLLAGEDALAGDAEGSFYKVIAHILVLHFERLGGMHPAEEALIKILLEPVRLDAAPTDGP